MSASTASTLPQDYDERVYAGVLGKLIGVYLGRPFENWSNETIERDLGEINYYVHERRKVPLIVTDDDISGTFTFLRALEDFGYRRDLSAEQIGQTWQNYIIENRTVLWWGGMGNSTEHTAFQRLKKGIPAPRSGSMELNGRVVAEQIGSQIFIDGWGLVSPGDPERAADLARRAASVSHDGEAIYGAQVVAALVAQAFVEKDMGRLLDTAVRFIPADSVIRRLIDDIRNWRGADNDWRKTRQRISGHYGYEKYGGGCHMVPNHGLIILALLYGDDNFQRSLMVVNTCGWDTDCNSGNVGCILGVKNGLAGLENGPDWRGPMADRLFLPTADGGRCVTDAVRETQSVIRAGRALAGERYAPPKNGARYHFSFPGSVQGFLAEESEECRGLARVRNAPGHSRSGSRSLAIDYNGVATGRNARVATATFMTPDSAQMQGYGMVACPALYPGQVLRAAVEADTANAGAVTVRLFVRFYGADDKPAILRGPIQTLNAGASARLEWPVPETGAGPIFETGIEIASERRADGTVYLDELTWEGAPETTFDGHSSGTFWKKAWTNAAGEVWFGRKESPFRIMQQEGPGLLIQGTREWAGYTASTTVAPHLAESAGLAVCVQGQKRYYALLLCRDQKVRLVKEYYGRTVLAEADFSWAFDQKVALSITTRGAALEASVDGKRFFSISDAADPLLSGAVALVIEEGRLDAGAVRISPA